MRILIVDDSKDSRLLQEAILKKSGYLDILHAESAEEAFFKLGIDNPKQKGNDVDLIIMDILMPGVDGIQACKIIKETEHLQDIPIVVVTGKEDDLQTAFLAGATDFIRKPFNKVEFLARVQSALKLKREMDKRKERENKIQKDLQLAKLVQTSVLSASLKEPGIELDAAYLPSADLSGDMYYWCSIDENRYGIFLIDIAGHGVSSALISMSVRSIVNDLLKRLVDPVRVFQELSHHTESLFGKSKRLVYFTGFYAVINTRERTIEYVNAGHPPALLLERSASGQIVSRLRRTTTPIGLLPRSLPLCKKQITYQEPSRMIIYTDGLIETPGRRINLAIEELSNRMVEYIHLENQAFIEKIISIRKETHALSDDVCLVSISLS